MRDVDPSSRHDPDHPLGEGSRKNSLEGLGIGNKKAGGSMSLGCLKINPARLSHLQVIP